jgi:hypothetical protein
MDGIDVFIGVFVKLIPVMLAVAIPLASMPCLNIVMDVRDADVSAVRLVSTHC